MAVCSAQKRTGKIEETSRLQSDVNISTGSESYDFGNTLSFPTIGDNQNKKLVKGVYRINAYVETDNEEPVAVDDFTQNINYLGDVKRVRYKRVTISAPKMIDGKKLSQLNAVVSIDENPLPIGIILWGAIGATGLGAGGYFINSVNRFTESSFNQVVAVAGVALTAYFALRK